MARSLFGGTSDDWVLTPYRFGDVTLLALREDVLVLTFWSAQTGGTQYTDLLNAAGQPVTRIEMTGYQIPRFQGPDGVDVMWVDKGDGSPRELIEAQAAVITVVSAADIGAVQDLGGFARVAGRNLSQGFPAAGDPVPPQEGDWLAVDPNA